MIVASNWCSQFSPMQDMSINIGRILPIYWLFILYTVQAQGSEWKYMYIHITFGPCVVPTTNNILITLAAVTLTTPNNYLIVICIPLEVSESIEYIHIEFYIDVYVCMCVFHWKLANLLKPQYSKQGSMWNWRAQSKMSVISGSVCSNGFSYCIVFNHNKS